MLATAAAEVVVVINECVERPEKLTHNSAVATADMKRRSQEQGRDGKAVATAGTARQARQAGQGWLRSQRGG